VSKGVFLESDTKPLPLFDDRASDLSERAARSLSEVAYPGPPTAVWTHILCQYKSALRISACEPPPGDADHCPPVTARTEASRPAGDS
jgi:hypothetical protein